MTEVIMPKMGDGMEEGTLLSWSKSDGDKVKAGDIIGEIQTDKATLELEAPGSGTLTGFLIGEGDTVPVGQPIAAILKKDEALPEDWGSADRSPSAVEPATEPDPVDAPAPVAEPSQPEATPEPATSTRVKASPLARRIAKELGVDLASIQGSGPGGRIVEKDVRAAGETQPAAAPATTAVAQPTLAVPAGEDVKVPLNNLRKIIAQRTQEAKQQAPHFYVTVEVDLEKIDGLRAMFKEEEGGRVSVNDFVVRASVLALQEMPEANATFKGDHIVRYGSIHVGVAAAIDDGLLVPVIKNAHAMTLRQLSAAAKDLVSRAREGKLLPDEMSGSTFSISNMGMLDVDNFGAIINLPNAAILAISSARRKPVVNADDELEIRTRMNVTGSFDHRVLDGADGAKFMNLVRKYLENPTHLLS